MYDLQVYPRSVGCLYSVVFVLIFKIFVKSNLSVFTFVNCAFGVRSKEHCHIVGYVVLSPGSSHIKM